ncbi:hypothetical protein BD770DRAFT_476761 [Pilaira anomala]|nr:hypothetical protein BD770DRAFT_476761 [Pilaira anomala]
MSDKEQRATKLLEEGKRSFSEGKYDTSISQLSEACQLLDEMNGSLSLENGDAFFLYGEALLQYAIQRNTVLGQSAQASAEAVEEQQEMEKEVKAESSNPLVQLGDMPDFTKKVEEEEEEEVVEDEEEGEETAADVDEDFETAWDILDIARVIFEKGDDKKTQLKLADVHLCLGDVSLETEKFNEALTDYEKAIEIKKGLLEEDNRELAEAHYKYALALELSSDKSDQAIPELQKAVAVLKKRIETLEPGSKEISEIKELIPDIEFKIEELSNRQASEKEAEAMLKAMLTGNNGTKAKEISNSTPVNDLSTLVKRKVVKSVDQDQPKDKKQKLD